MGSYKDKLYKYAFYTFLIIIAIAILGAALTSEDVDQLCDDNHTLLYRNATNNSWVCTNANQFFNAAGDTNESIRMNTLVESDCTPGYHVEGWHENGTAICTEDKTSIATALGSNLTIDRNIVGQKIYIRIRYG